MWRHVLLLIVVLYKQLADASIYCAKWNVTGSVGVFVVETVPQSAAIMAISGSFNTSIINTQNCPTGLNWHYHAGWQITESSSRACGNANSLTFNHYDPTFACAPNSQWINTPFCNRTSVDPPRASYNCSVDRFKENPYNCEVGDLSGKFGKIEIVDGELKTKEKHVYDNLPPSDTDFEENSAGGTKWSSIILHCGAPRVVCAKIYKVNSWDECVIEKYYVPSPSSLTLAEDSKTGMTIGITILVTTIFWAAAVLVWLLYKKKTPKDQTKTVKLTTSSPTAIDSSVVKFS